MVYQEEYNKIKERYKNSYDTHMDDTKKEIYNIKSRYKADLQGGMIEKELSIFRGIADSLQNDYEKEVEKLIESVENRMAQKKEKPEKERYKTKDDEIISLMTKQNELLEKNGKLSILLERTRVFDEEYLIGLLEEEFNKEDKDIYNLVLSKVNAMDKETTTNIRNKVKELENSTPEKKFQMFRGNFNLEKAGSYGRPSFSPNKLDNVINEISNSFDRYTDVVEKSNNPYF